MSWFSVDGHSPSQDCNATIILYEALDTRSNSSTNQTPRVNVARRWYGSAMEFPAMTHGTVDQGGSICGPEKKLQGLAKV